MIRKIYDFSKQLIVRGMIFLVRAYQVLIRPLLPPTCIYEPGCSEYMILAVKKYGPLKGCCKGCYRILRCNPFNKGRIDYP
jgi:putative membrane protein insertion efficiency factor